MPTGYTAYIEDGEITTGAEFLKLCTRAFGIAIELKDEPLSIPTPTHFELNSYYKKRYIEALENLLQAYKLTFEEATYHMKNDYEKRISNYKSLVDKEIATNKKYEKIRKEVVEWNPPTEEHKDLKKFALEQIDMSMTKQKYIDEYIEKSKEEFDDRDDAIKSYIQDNINFRQEEVHRAYTDLQNALEKTKHKNEWMTKFLDSLE